MFTPFETSSLKIIKPMKFFETLYQVKESFMSLSKRSITRTAHHDPLFCSLGIVHKLRSRGSPRWPKSWNVVCERSLKGIAKTFKPTLKAIIPEGTGKSWAKKNAQVTKMWKHKDKNIERFGKTLVAQRSFEGWIWIKYEINLIYWLNNLWQKFWCLHTEIALKCYKNILPKAKLLWGHSFFAMLTTMLWFVLRSRPPPPPRSLERN